MQEKFSSLEWIKRIQINRESVGISKQVIDRFIKYYIEKG